MPIEDWEKALASGEAGQVKQQISSLNLSKVARAQAAHLAEIAHRLNLPNTVIRLLNPIIRNEKQALDPPSPKELAEYSLALNRIGASDEAVALMENLKDDSYEKVWLYRAFIYMTQWRYSKASTCLRKHLKSIDQSSYAAVIAKINLAAAKVFLEETDEASSLLNDVIGEARKKELKVLLGNAHELSSQVAIIKNDFSTAQDHLEKASVLLKSSHGLGSFFVEKWSQILKVKSNQVKVHELSELREKALRIGHWETIRDCDYIQAKITEDQALVRHLYFGTPFKEYRKRLSNQFSFKPNWREVSNWSPQVTLDATISDSQYPVLDVALGSYSDSSFQLSPSSVLHQLLFIMSRDFYRPMPLGLVFSRLYPGEFYDPVTSNDRAFKSIQRLRKELSISDVPLRIQEESGSYRLAGSSIFLKVGLKESLPSKEELELHHIYSHFENRPFKLKEAAQKVGLSEGKLRSIFSHPGNKRRVKRMGSGPGTRYKLTA